MLNALKIHWPEYLMEAAELGIFMISAALFGTLLEYPNSEINKALPDPFIRRVIMGLAMGVTAIAIIFSPIGKRSGAHFNPAVSFTFYRLGKISFWDASFYSLFQFVGGAIGIFLVLPFLGHSLIEKPVQYVLTLPGEDGAFTAFIVEVVISFFMMLMVLFVTNKKNIAHYTGVFAGILVAVYIILTGPISGMSINPARSFASAFPAQIWTSFWVYMTAPFIGMIAASEFYLRFYKYNEIICAKLHHKNNERCIFKNCRYKHVYKEGKNIAIPEYLNVIQNVK